jgi:anthranilate phosphoribosyltransferase
MQQIIEKVLTLEPLSKEEATNLMHGFAKGNATENQIKEVLLAFNKRAILPEEILGCREAMLNYTPTLKLDDDTIDLCGTGGDGKNTFNISTITAIVLAYLKVKVTKHGNYGVSSISGSSSVLQDYGFVFTNNLEKNKASLAEFNFAYFHAPLFHQSLKYVTPVRKAMQVKTIFNLMGPLVNPVTSAMHYNGTYDNSITQLYVSCLKQLNKNFYTFCSSTGYDEVTLVDEITIYNSKKPFTINASNFKLANIEADLIVGGSNQIEATAIFSNILNGKGSDAQKNVIAANAALGMQLYHNYSADYLQENFIKAKHILNTNEVGLFFQTLIDDSK